MQGITHAFVVASLGSRERRGPTEGRRVLTEVQSDALEPCSDPNHLARGGQLVEVRGLVTRNAAREQIAFPKRDRKGDSLERNQGLTQCRPPINAVPSRQEAPQRSEPGLYQQESVVSWPFRAEERDLRE